jgi:AcrR family transcriptional regulator
MTHLANTATRPYRSELRAQQVEATRARILDAAVRVMADGIATISIPAIAREARVSVPTIYRHFATKDELLAAVYPHLERRAGFDEMVVPRTIGELREGIREIFARLEAFDDLARAAMASPAAGDARRLTLPNRLAWSRRLADSVEPAIDAADRERLARLLMILTTSSALRLWRDHLGASVDDAADDIDWIVRAAIAAAEHPPRP